MTTATDMLAQYLAAESAILQGQEFSFEGRSLKRADLPSIRAGRLEWEKRAQSEAMAKAGGAQIGGLSFAVARMDK